MMKEPALLPAVPAPDEEWLHRFTEQLRAGRPDLPLFSARQMALTAFGLMHLLTPAEASDLWNQRMLATNHAWRRRPGR